MPGRGRVATSCRLARWPARRTVIACHHCISATLPIAVESLGIFRSFRMKITLAATFLGFLVAPFVDREKHMISRGAGISHVSTMYVYGIEVSGRDERREGLPQC